ncbi:MAG: biopolymer transporter ExbD [Deferrisomatales bacterium]
MRFRKARRDVVTPDITPLVDVVFLLLIFFMLSTTFVVSPGIRVNLPQAQAEPVRHEPQELRVKIDAAGAAFLEETRMSPDDLEARFETVARSDRDALVVIEADQDTAHRFVVEVMDRAKTAGLHRLAIATRPKR